MELDWEAVEWDQLFESLTYGTPNSFQLVAVLAVGVLAFLIRKKVLRWPFALKLVLMPLVFTSLVLNGVLRVVARVVRGPLVLEQWLSYEDGPHGPVPMRTRQRLPRGAYRRLARWEVDQFRLTGDLPEKPPLPDNVIAQMELDRQRDRDYWVDRNYAPMV